MTAAINISDGEQSPEQPPYVAGAGGIHLDEVRVEQPKESRLENTTQVEREQLEANRVEPRAEEGREDAIS